jgi:hypothetical protein
VCLALLHQAITKNDLLNTTADIRSIDGQCRGGIILRGQVGLGKGRIEWCLHNIRGSQSRSTFDTLSLLSFLSLMNTHARPPPASALARPRIHIFYRLFCLKDRRWYSTCCFWGWLKLLWKKRSQKSASSKGLLGDFSPIGWLLTLGRFFLKMGNFVPGHPGRTGWHDFFVIREIDLN